MSDLVKLIRAQWDRAVAAVCTLAGLLFLLFGWVGVSGAEAVVKQLPYIVSGGLGGIALVAVGAALWVSSDMRDEWNEVRRLRLTVERLEATDAERSASPNGVAEEIAATGSDRAVAARTVAAASGAGRESSSQAW